MMKLASSQRARKHPRSPIGCVILLFYFEYLFSSLFSAHLSYVSRLGRSSLKGPIHSNGTISSLISRLALLV
jgi:hypothetical protein